MSLQIWLPLNGELNDAGLSNVNIINSNAVVNGSGKIGQCYYFDKTAYLYDNTFDFSNFNTQTFSICCWYKMPSLESGNHQLITIGTSSGWNNIRIGLLIRTGTGAVLFSVSNGTNYIGYNCASQPLELDKWYHITATYNHGDIRIYLNGDLDKTYSTTIVPALNSSQHLGIGAASNGAEKIIGYLNDVRIYDHCLSLKEIQEIKKALVIHYTLDTPNYNLLYEAPYRNIPTDYHAYSANITSNLGVGTTYTLQLWDVDVQHSGKSTADLGIWVYWGSGAANNCLLHWQGEDFIDGHADYLVKTFTVPDTASSGVWRLYFYNSVPSVNGTKYMHIGRWKLEASNYPTEYTHNYKEDEGNGSLVYVYDSSGFKNNGLANMSSRSGYVAAFDGIKSPRYTRSTNFTGSTYIKIDTNKFMTDYVEEMTVNIWAYSPDWSVETDGGRLFSCTESGGFNIEGGASGYLRFATYIATNAARTSHAYKYNTSAIKIADMTPGWHMITYVYTTTNMYAYLDGQLSSSYSITTYGLKYNTNARLFLGCEASTANPGGSYFYGLMSDFRMYYTALSADEIYELYSVSASADRNHNIYSYCFQEVES